MDFLTLDSALASTTRFQPTRLIENYSSLIWTERYWSSGDFELITADVERTLQALPLESFVAIRESTVPMIVESHKIDKPKGKGAVLTVKGRSFESVLERRATFSEVNRNAAPPRTAESVRITASKVSDAGYKMMRNAIGDSVARADLPAVSPANVNDVIPHLNLVLPTDYAAGNGTPFEIKAGSLLPVLLEMLEVNRHGIRAVRPAVASTKTTVDIEIYNGADLRTTAIFDARFDQFDSANYLLSYQGSTNVAYVYGPGGVTARNKTTTTPSGLDRRVVVVDEMSDQTLNDANRDARGLIELYKNNAIALFDGEVANQVVQRFNKPIAQGGFGLGDILLFRGEYGIERPMRVAEWVRSSDSNGETAYPTFQVVDE